MTFQEYWEREGSHIEVASDEERARLAWDAREKYGERDDKSREEWYHDGLLYGKKTAISK